MRVQRERCLEGSLVILICAALLTTSLVLLPTGSAETEDESRTLRIGMLSDMPDLNIFNPASNSVWKDTVLDWTFESIMIIDYDSRPVPHLATGWTFDQDTLTVDIDLREGVLFHDGTEMTAEDVKFSYLMAREGTVYSSAIIPPFDTDSDYIVTEAEIDYGIQVISDYQVRMVMSAPYGQFFSSTLTVPVLPMHIWEDHVDPENRVDVLWGVDPEATIGTGPFYYAEGVPGDFRVLKKFTEYWGQGYMTPEGYRTYPPNVDKLHFAVKPDNGEAIAALRSGEIDHIASPVPADELTAIETDTRIAIDYIEDAGYFFLAFNEKKEPFGRLPFRKAVSHLIDKAHVVDTYLGGLAVQGTTAVPPYYGAWHNEAVEDYVYDDPDDSSTSIPEDILDDAGYCDVNGDGFRDLPDGTPMEKLMIYAPPADYDPVRIRTAEMIASNLVKVGINAEALPVAFNTLVGKMYSFDYDMMISGFRFGGYTECVSVLFDVFGASTASNSWAFWSDMHPNPLYSDLGSVSTLADDETQTLVDSLYDIESAARSTFDPMEQISLVRQGQGTIMEAAPCNILYYRVNAMVTSTSWSGWVPHMGTLLNMFSLSELVGESADRSFIDTTQGVNVGLSAPKTLVLDDVVSGHVQVIDDLGWFVQDADVSLTFEPISPAVMDVTINPSSGKTDADGMFTFTISGATEGSGVLTATADDGVYSDEDSMTVSMSPALPTTLMLSATIESAVVCAGESVDVTLKVLDEHELPVEGAEVCVDELLICYGTVTPATAVTDSSGLATMTYNAPFTLRDPSSHQLERMLFSVSKSGYQHNSTAYLEMLLYSDAPPDWSIVKVSSVTSTALSYVSSMSTVTVQAVDDEGAALAFEPLTVNYSDESYVSTPVTDVTTDSEGYASFDVEASEGASSGAFKVTIACDSAEDSVSASVTFTHVDEDAGVHGMYGGYITYDEAAQFMPSMGTLQATVHVWDSNGNPAEGKAALVLPVPMEGPPVSSDQAEYDSRMDYTGLEVTTFADDFCRLASGPLSVPGLYIEGYDPWIPPQTLEGVDMIAGVIELALEGVDVSTTDLLGEIIIIPNGTGYVDWSTFNFMIEGQTSIVGEFGCGRSYEVLSASHEIEAPMMLALDGPYDVTTVTAMVTDQNGDPVPDVAVSFYSVGGMKYYGVLDYDWPWSPDCVYTDAEGMAEVTIIAAENNYVVTDSFLSSNVYVLPGSPGAISLPSQSNLFICPQNCRIEGVPVTAAVSVEDGFEVRAYVSDITADPMAGMSVHMFAGTDETVTGEAVTDVDGNATFAIEAFSIDEFGGGFVPITFWTSGPGYDYSAARLMVPAQLLLRTTASLSGTQGYGDWYVSDVEVTLSAEAMYELDRTMYRVDEGSWQEYSGPFVVSGDGEHKVEFYSMDIMDNTEPISSTVFRIDTTPPTVQITSPLEDEIVTESAVLVTWDQADLGSGLWSVFIRLDDGDPELADSGLAENEWSLESLSEGAHTFEVNATDVAGNWAVAIVNFTVDAALPTIDITLPSEGSALNAETVTVSWSATDAETTEYEVDGGDWEVVSGTSVDIPSLDEGDHSVSIRVTDLAGNNATDSVSFTIDRTAPSVYIHSPGTGAVNLGPVLTVYFYVDDGAGSGVETVEVRIDSGAWVAADSSSSHNLTGLSDGEHSLQVRAWDLAGNDGTDSSTFNVIIDTAAPTVSILFPTNASYIGDDFLTVTWTTSDDIGIGGTEVKLDDGDWLANLDGSRAFFGLAEGLHTVSVRVTDFVGNSATANVTFTIDTLAPTLSITSPEDAWETDDDSVTVEWDCDDSASGVDYVEIRIDGGTYTDVENATSYTFSDLLVGDHTVTLRAFDKAGNYNESSVMFTVSEGGGISVVLIGGIALVAAAALVAAIMLMKRRKVKGPESIVPPDDEPPGTS
jgi:ABC-type transport system substrate-binding protein